MELVKELEETALIKFDAVDVVDVTTLVIFCVDVENTEKSFVHQ